jgi:hypothetical protein
LHDTERCEMHVWLRVEQEAQKPVGGGAHSPGVCVGAGRCRYRQGWAGFTVTSLDVAQAVAEPIVEEATDG